MSALPMSCGSTRQLGSASGRRHQPAQRAWICHGNEERLEEGMFVAIEGFLGTQNIGGAMFEENGFIGPDGYENLSTSKRRYQG